MGLSVDLEVHPTPGEVSFTITVTNNDAKPHTLTFPTGQRIEVTVTDGDEVVWRYSDDRMFTQARHEESLGPGEMLSATATWGNPRHGTYDVEAVVTTVNADLRVETLVAL